MRKTTATLLSLGLVATSGVAYAAWKTTWTALSGETTDQPAASTLNQQNGKSYTFIKVGTGENSLKYKTFNGTSFSAWTSVPGGTTNMAPATTYTGNDGSLWLFIKGGGDNKIYMRTYRDPAYGGPGWGSWSEVPGGGLTSHAPAACAFGDSGEIMLVVKGLGDNSLWQNRRTTIGSWTGWSKFSGAARDTQTDTQPACLWNYLENRMKVFTKEPGILGKVYSRMWDPSAGWIWAPVVVGSGSGGSYALFTKTSPSATLDAVDTPFGIAYFEHVYAVDVGLSGTETPTIRETFGDWNNYIDSWKVVPGGLLTDRAPTADNWYGRRLLFARSSSTAILNYNTN